MPPSYLAMELASRAVGFSSTSNITCARPMKNDNGVPLFAKDGKDGITFHTLMIYVSAVLLVPTFLSCWFLSWRHLHRYTAPLEQKQILRIVNLPANYALFNFLALCFVIDYQYIEPIQGVYEAFAVGALFLLILEYVAPDGTDREKYFDNLELKDRRGRVQPGGSLKWFQRTWQTIFMYPVLKTILITVEIITQYFDDYCESSWSPKHAHLYLTIADYLFIGGATGAMYKFYSRVRKECAPVHRPRPKIFSFFGILFFQMIQDLIFHLLNGKLFSPSAKITYNDINFGLASFLTCIEAIVFSLIFHWSYSSGEFKEGEKMNRLGSGPAQRTKTFKAVVDALNVSDIVAGGVLAFQLFFTRVQSRYGGSSGGQQQRLQRLGSDDQVHLEPLTGRQNFRGGQDAYMPPDDTEYESQTQYPQGYAPPPMPKAARDPSPGANYGRNQTLRADGLRPEYEPYGQGGYGRSASPEGQPLTQSRSFA